MQLANNALVNANKSLSFLELMASTREFSKIEPKFSFNSYPSPLSA